MKSTALPLLLLWCAALALAGSAAGAQQLVVEPGPTVLSGEPVALKITGARPGATLTLRATRPVHDGFTGQVQIYASEASFVADAAGAVDLARSAPETGASWQGADARGPFWSMVPTRVDASDRSQPADRERVRFELKDGDRVLDTCTLHLQHALPEVQQRSADGLPGAVYAHLPLANGAPKRAALILLGGSEGGSQITRSAPVYASRGFAVLALPYYSPPGWSPSGPTPPELPALPQAFAEIPVDRLQQARDWLAAQPEVDASRIGIVGTSKGAEFALLAGTKFDWVRAIVACVPTDVVWEGWGQGIGPDTKASFAWKGEPFAFVPYQDFQEEFAGFATGAPVKIRRPHDNGRTAHPQRVAAARIPVERIVAPVLVAGSHDDQVWNSGAMAEAIATTRAVAGRETVALVFPEAGHYLGSDGFGPTTQYDAGPMKSGGTPAANARAQAQVFTAVMGFLGRVLGQ